MFRFKRCQDTQNRAGFERSNTAFTSVRDCDKTNTTRQHRIMLNRGSIKREILSIMLCYGLVIISVDGASDHEEQESLLTKYGNEGICVLERANIDKIMKSTDESFKISDEISKVLKYTNKLDKIDADYGSRHSEAWSYPGRGACQNMKPRYKHAEEESRIVDEIADKLIIAIDEAMRNDPKYKFFKPVRAKGTFTGQNDRFDQIIKYSAVENETRHKCNPHVDAMQPHLRALLVVQNTEEGQGGELLSFNTKRFHKDLPLNILHEDDLEYVKVLTEADGMDCDEQKLVRGRGKDLEVVLLDEEQMKELGYNEDEIPRKTPKKGLECEVRDRKTNNWVKCKYIDYVPFNKSKVKIKENGEVHDVSEFLEDDGSEAPYELIRGPHTTENFPIVTHLGKRLPEGWIYQKDAQMYHNKFLKRTQKKRPSGRDDSMSACLPVLGEKVLSNPGDLVLIPSQTFQKQHQFLFNQSSMFGAKHMVTPVRGKTDRIRVSFDMALVKRKGYAKCQHCHEKNFACEDRRVMDEHGVRVIRKTFKVHRVGGNDQNEACSKCDGTGYVECDCEDGCKNCQKSEFHVTQSEEWPSDEGMKPDSSA